MLNWQQKMSSIFCIGAHFFFKALARTIRGLAFQALQLTLDSVVGKAEFQGAQLGLDLSTEILQGTPEVNTLVWSATKGEMLAFCARH